MHIITIICLILFLLCLFIPMNTGKLAWLSLIVVIIFAYVLKRNNLKWKRYHISLSIIFSILVVIHIVHAIIL